MTDTLNSSEWLDDIFGWECGGPHCHHETAEAHYILNETCKAAVIAHISSELVKARKEMAAMYSAMGRDDISWGTGGLPKEVLVVFPGYAKSTADIPRGKKQFMDFVQAQLLNGEKTMTKEERG